MYSEMTQSSEYWTEECVAFIYFLIFDMCPIIVVTFASKLWTPDVTTIMGQK